MVGDDWRERAACRGYPTSLFFLVDDEKPAQRRDRERMAKALCARCDVVNHCFDAGREEMGIWGGLTERERSYRSNRVVLERYEPDNYKPQPNATVVESNWIVIDKRGKAELWQRSTSASWHGSEWCIATDGAAVKKTFDLAEAYFMFEQCYIGGV